MDLAAYAELMASLEQASARYDKIRILAQSLTRCDAIDRRILPLAVLGQFFAPAESRQTGVSSKIVLKAMAKAYAKKPDELEDAWREKGDLGLVAQECAQKTTQSSLSTMRLTLGDVYEKIRSFAGMEGKGTVEKKTAILAGFISAARPREAKYLVRLLIGDLRAGIGEGNVRDAIITAYILDAPDELQIPRALSDRAQAVLDVLNDLGELAERVHGDPEGFSATAEVMRPIKSMLAVRSTSLADALSIAKLPCFLEPKFDGFRVQIHKDGDAVRFFTRRLEDVTVQFSEMILPVQRNIRASRAILDSEFVGYDPTTGTARPFQEISQRIRRKYDIERLARELPVVIKVFDILYRDGEDVMGRRFEERRGLLEESVHVTERMVERSECVR